jgi:hypothetical protein
MKQFVPMCILVGLVGCIGQVDDVEVVEDLEALEEAELDAEQAPADLAATEPGTGRVRALAAKIYVPLGGDLMTPGNEVAAVVAAPASTTAKPTTRTGAGRTDPEPECMNHCEPNAPAPTFP